MHELVSVVLPTYNRAGLLPSAMASCLVQTYADLELLVVDDGSNDNTQSVVQEYMRRDARVRYIRQENAGLPSALNTGFRSARGELWTWTSDDNVYDPEAIATMAQYLRDHPSVGLVYCDMRAVDERGRVVGRAELPEPTTITRSNPVGACFLYRRSVAAIVGEYDREMVLAEDYDYWLRISKVTELAHLAGVAPYQYRVHKKSLSSQRGAEVRMQTARVLVKYASSPSQRRALLAEAHCAAASVLCCSGNYRAAARHCTEAMSLHPVLALSWLPRTAFSKLRHRVASSLGDLSGLGERSVRSRTGSGLGT